MADDNSFDISIRVNADTAGAQKVKKELTGIANTAVEGGKLAVKAEAEVAAATEKTFTSKKQLKDMLKQLGHEFPLLGSIGRMALNPIVLVTASITAGLQIWKTRMTELERTYAGLDFSAVDAHIAKVNQLEQAWLAVAKAAAAAREEYHSADNEAGRRNAEINAEFDAKGKAATTPAGKAAVEDERAAALAASRKKEIQDSRAEAARKMAEANSIKVATAEQDAAIGNTLADNAAKARKDKEERMARRGDISEAMAMDKYDPARVVIDNKLKLRYGDAFGSMTYDDMWKAETEGIGRSQQAIDAEANFNKAKPDRDSKRARKGELISGAARAEARAAGLDEGNSDFTAKQSRDSQRRWQEVGGNAGMVAQASAGADAINAGGNATAEQKASISAAAKAFGLVGMNNKAILNILGRINDNQESFAQSLARLEGQVKTGGRMPR